MLALDKKTEVLAFFESKPDSFDIKFYDLKQLVNIQLQEDFLEDLNKILSVNLEAYYSINYESLGYVGGVISKNDTIDETLIRFKRRGLYCFNKNQNIYKEVNYEQQIKMASMKIKQAFLSKNLNFLIGSGCSLPVIPLMGQTFKKIKSQYTEMPLGEYNGDSGDIEGYLNWLNTAIRFHERYPGMESNAGYYKSWFDIVKKELLDSIANYHKNTNKELESANKNYLEFYNAIFDIRNNKDFSPVNIYTTNYDLLNEVNMESLNIHYTNGFSGTVNRRFDPSVFNFRLVDDENRYKDKWSVIKRYVKLYKLHGSIDWVFDNESIKQCDSKIDSENVVIYPTINKHLETQQSPYSELLRAFTINLQKPDSTLIVIGYGFPDEHLNQLISQALSNEDFTLIIIGNNEEVKVSEFYSKHQYKSNVYLYGGTLEFLNDGHHFSNFLKLVGDSKNE